MTIKNLNSIAFLHISKRQIEDLRRVCQNLLLGTYFRSVAVSDDGYFRLKDNEGEIHRVDWKTMSLIIIPNILGIRNIIIDTECPMHPADFVMEEYKKSLYPEIINVVKCEKE
jgi:hypothetical protein